MPHIVPAFQGQSLAGVATTLQTYTGESVEFISKSRSADLASGSGETVYLYAPTGYLYEVLAIVLWAGSPINATSGTHYFLAKSETYEVGLTMGESTYDLEVYYDRGMWMTANSKVHPTDGASQLNVVRNVRVDDSNAFAVTYVNNTDVTQIVNRSYVYWVRKIKVA